MNTHNDISFGEVHPEEEYRDREGAYALIQNEQGQVAIVGRVDRELYELPGGGIDPGESREEALRRELREELGWGIEINDYLGTAIQHTVSGKGIYMRLIGRFYAAKKVGDIGGKIEEDHTYRWMSIDEAADKVLYEYQNWAVRRFREYLSSV